MTERSYARWGCQVRLELNYLALGRSYHAFCLILTLDVDGVVLVEDGTQCRGAEQIMTERSLRVSNQAGARLLGP